MAIESAIAARIAFMTATAWGIDGVASNKFQKVFENGKTPMFARV